MGASVKELDSKKAGFKLYEHPWLAMLAVILITIIAIIPANILVSRGMGLPNDSYKAAFTIISRVVFFLSQFLI